MPKVGLDRTAAAAWVSKRAAYRVPMTTLRNWERGGLIRDQRPGRRVACVYGVRELVGAEILASLRRDGAPLQRIRRALRELGRLLPDVLERPGEWHLLVDGEGHVMRWDSAATLLELTRAPGQLTTFTLFDAGAIAREARAAVEKKAHAA